MEERFFFHYLFFDKENFMMTWWPKSLCERESILKCLRLDTNLDGEKKRLKKKWNEAIIEMEFFLPKDFAEKRPIFNDSKHASLLKNETCHT